MKKPKISKKKFEADKIKAQIEVFIKHVKQEFKSRKVEDGRYRFLTIDKGGEYLEDSKTGDRLKTFVTINWVANNELKELVMSFSTEGLAMNFSKAFKKEYKNSRVLKTLM